MRNKHAGTCYKCGKKVEVGEGFFERHEGKWRIQHAKCKNTPTSQKGKE